MKRRVYNKKPLHKIKMILALLSISIGIYFLKDGLGLNTQINQIFASFPNFFSAMLDGDEVIDVMNNIGDNILRESIVYEETPTFLPVMSNIHELNGIEDYKKYLYTVDETAYADESILNVNKLLEIDVKTKLSDSEPKVLIMHTHSQEDFINSREGKEEDTIVGVGNTLADILAKDYGVSVVHDYGQYDVVNGETIRGNSYERMEPAIRKVLERYPSIELVIDLHRDGVNDDVVLLTEVDGKPTAKLMFFNGICNLYQDGEGKPVEDLPNPYLEENLALSLKLQLKANELHPTLMRKLYIKPYRYSLHLMPKTILVEAGANTNTVDEVKNAMKPLAEILVNVINEQ